MRSLKENAEADSEADRKSGIRFMRRVRLCFHDFAGRCLSLEESPIRKSAIREDGACLSVGWTRDARLAPLLLRLSNPYAPQEIQIYDDHISSLSRGALRQFQWRPGRGFKENGGFFFFWALRDEATWIVPKRAVTHEQELELRKLLRRASAD